MMKMLQRPATKLSVASCKTCTQPRSAVELVQTRPAAWRQLSAPEADVANKFTDAAFAARGLTGTEKLILWVLCHRTNNETGKCFPSYARIASDACISRSAAMRAVKALIHLGLVSKCGTHGYKDSEQTNVFQVSLEKLREMSEPQKEKDLTGSVAQGGELQNEPAVEAQGTPPSGAAQSGELRSAVRGEAQSYSNSSTNSELNSELNSSPNSSSNQESVVSQGENEKSSGQNQEGQNQEGQNQEGQNQNQNQNVPSACYPSYNPSAEEAAILTHQLETLYALWASEHDTEAEEPDTQSFSYNMMNLIWAGNPTGSPTFEIAEQIEEVLQWLPKSKHWDTPKPEGLGRFRNSAEFCRLY